MPPQVGGPSVLIDETQAFPNSDPTLARASANLGKKCVRQEDVPARVRNPRGAQEQPAVPGLAAGMARLWRTVSRWVGTIEGPSRDHRWKIV